MSTKLTKQQISAAFLALDAECRKLGIAGEICIYGGAQMVLVFDARTSTRDVDAVFRPKSEILRAVSIVADLIGLPSDWINDGVKGFLSHNEQLTDEPIAGLDNLTNLRVLYPTAEYLLAMKCLAARSEEVSEDRNDVEFLARRLGLKTEESVFAIIEKFYPLERIHVKSRYFVSEIISGLAGERKSGDQPR